MQSGSLYTDRAGKDQQRASCPTKSFWVNASAGTGKTKVLIDRVLRLLLPRPDGRGGTRPDKILCITYTKAAAAEMTNRLLDRTRLWSISAQEKIVQDLIEMTGENPTSDQINTARGLFTRLLDGPEKIRVMTIHAFCQSILARFPLEAGISPHFELIDDQKTAELIKKARQSVFIEAQTNENLAQNLHDLVRLISDENFSDVIDNLLSEQRQLSFALHAYDGKDRDLAIKKSIGLSGEDTPDKLSHDIMYMDQELEQNLKILVEAFSENGTKSEKDLARYIEIFLLAESKDRTFLFDTLKNAFFRTTGERRSDGRAQGIRKKDQRIADLYIQCGDRVHALWSRAQMMELFFANKVLLFVGAAIIKAYEDIKLRENFLDFDDLIRYTHKLLSKAGDENPSFLSWVMFKLDGGIDHILLDEAQDTNPEQWEIIKILARDFFTVEKNERDVRTLFIVGDQKQSIYRFQGANSEEFMRLLNHLGKDMETVNLDVSFRSVPAVLKTVDYVFSVQDNFSALHLETPPLHLPARSDQGGRVVLWPVTKTEENGKDDAEEDDDDNGEEVTSWVLPLEDRKKEKPTEMLATHIAQYIDKIIKEKYILSSHGRPVRAGDIMVLTQKRRPLMPYLVAALQHKGVAVSGLDRLRVADDLAVQDLVAALSFAFCPHDDFSLACLMKSPLMGLDDTDLIALAPNRSGTLYDAIKSNLSYEHFTRFLDDLIVRAQDETPYDFLYGLLSRPCPSKSGKSGWHMIFSRLGMPASGPINALLDKALLASKEGQTLRFFTDYIQHDKTESKQESRAREDAVQIMTVHGAKGLEAPIVILADAIPSARKPRGAGIFWPEKTGAPLPIWAPRAAERPEGFKKIEEEEKKAEEQEYKRLLYVAMTRARDELIVTGADKGEKPFEKSWYKMVADAFKICSGNPSYTGAPFAYEEDEIYEQDIFSCPQIGVPDRAVGEHNLLDIDKEIDLKDSILHAPIPIEAVPLRPLRPDRPSIYLSAQSPLGSNPLQLYVRYGTYLHKLLQVLPNFPPSDRERKADIFLGTVTPPLSCRDQEKIKSDVMRILDDPVFNLVFSEGSYAEVPVTGTTGDGRLISGRIDRLCITSEFILIVDYKTNRKPPSDKENIPAPYLAQMRAYRDLLKAIYPGRPVRCALLWTETARLMPLSDGF